MAITNMIRRNLSTILATAFHSSFISSLLMFLFIFVVMSLQMNKKITETCMDLMIPEWTWTNKRTREIVHGFVTNSTMDHGTTGEQGRLHMPCKYQLFFLSSGRMPEVVTQCQLEIPGCVSHIFIIVRRWTEQHTDNVNIELVTFILPQKWSCIRP